MAITNERTHTCDIPECAEYYKTYPDSSAFNTGWMPVGWDYVSGVGLACPMHLSRCYTYVEAVKEWFIRREIAVDDFFTAQDLTDPKPVFGE